MYIRVRAIPGAKRELVIKKSPDTYHISVREPAERLLANKRILEILAMEYSVPKGKIRLISGHQSPNKIFSVDI